MKKVLLIALLPLMLLLSACSVFSPVKEEPTTNYVISASPQPDTKRSSGANLLVAAMETTNLYNTTDIAYTTRPYEIGYFAKSAWAEPPAQMIQPLIIQTLRKTHRFHSVGSLTYMGQYDYVLNTQLIQLIQDDSVRPPRVRVVLRAQILNAGSNQIVASKEFAINQVIYQNTPYSGVQATNIAVERLLRQLAQFCIKHI